MVDGSGSAQHIHFVTGRLAAPLLEGMLTSLAPSVEFTYSMSVLPISVAALMTPKWIAQRVEVPAEATEVLIPGYCEGELAVIERAVGIPVSRGPRDLRRLPEHFGRPPLLDFGAHQIEILAEINHAPQLELSQLIATANRLVADGADIIDVGCDPGYEWNGVGEAVRALRAEGIRVSIDSFSPREVEAAVRAGAELVLSVDARNRDVAAEWGAAVVAIPDEPESLAGLDTTVEQLQAAGVTVWIDPILEPIGLGFAASLARYVEVRRRYPDAEMLMGIGNLTELTDVDSAGVNVTLLGFCAELGIRRVLTTEVIHWAKSSVRECDLARRLVHYACTHQTYPKHVDNRLIMLRDEQISAPSVRDIERMASQIRDNNFRIFVEGRNLHMVGGGHHWQDLDPFALFAQVMAAEPSNLDASHAFYLGYELAKAVTARTLDKQYEQDEPLQWGHLTEPENYFRVSRRRGGGGGVRGEDRGS